MNDLIATIQKYNEEAIANTILFQAKMCEILRNFSPAADSDEDYLADEIDKISSSTENLKLILTKFFTPTNSVSKFETRVYPSDKFKKNANITIVKILIKNYLQLLINFNDILELAKKELVVHITRRIKLYCTMTDGSTIPDANVALIAEQIIQSGKSDAITDKVLWNRLIVTRIGIIRIEVRSEQIKEYANEIELLFRPKINKSDI